MVLYDNIYDVEDYFGEPYPGLIHFFENYPKRGHILDLGCGQGRDAINLAKLGYRVTGIDVSQLGIDQLNKKATKQNLNIQAFVEDMFQYPIDQSIDYILLDSMLHFEKNDKKKEVQLVNRIATELKPGGLMCICIWKSAKKEKILKNIFKNHISQWEVLHDAYTPYTFEDKNSDHKVEMEYNIYIVKKRVLSATQ